MDEPTVPVRCAIYTRKSTEEGLEQQFNTLRAQRESAEAYIASQRQAGWQALPDRYDDGGFSGATLERPALKKLLSDIETGKIDIVLVYKVDRLSRSLLDFARLVELFNRHRVSFVSVTQEFNTTSSLGRLTLHILLSFAQFEREIIGERTRDKLGAARRKGKWIGGSPVLGYEVEAGGGRLVVNEAEAGQVREMFEIAARAGSLDEILSEVQQRGFLSKRWTSSNGIQRGGRSFSRATLRLLLSNVLYTGEVSYKGTVYPGEHAEIVDRELWQLVNDRLTIRSAPRRPISPQKPQSTLGQLLCCDRCGSKMLATYSLHRGQRYEYYVCDLARRSKRANCRQTPVAAADIESSLGNHLRSLLGGEISASVLNQRLEQVRYDSQARRITIVEHNGQRSEYRLPEPVRPGARSVPEIPDRARTPRISRLMALAIKLQRLVCDGQISSARELAAAGHISKSRLSQILALTNLAPVIQEELLFLPKIYTGKDWVSESALRKIARSVDWEWQMQQFRLLMSLSPQNTVH